MIFLERNFAMSFLGFSTPSESQREKYLKEHVGWCYSQYKSCSYLSRIVFDLNYRNLASSEYLYNSSAEKEFLTDIIEDFILNLLELYFEEKLGYCYSYNQLSNEEYFLFVFENYLEKRCARTELAGRILAEERDRKDYGSWGLSHYSANHYLTDYGVTFNKILYLVELACSKSNYISNIHGRYHHEITKQYIDSRVIAVSRL